jgi:hypothetical protein
MTLTVIGMKADTGVLFITEWFSWSFSDVIYILLLLLLSACQTRTFFFIWIIWRDINPRFYLLFWLGKQIIKYLLGIIKIKLCPTSDIMVYWWISYIANSFRLCQDYVSTYRVLFDFIYKLFLLANLFFVFIY